MIRSTFPYGHAQNGLPCRTCGHAKTKHKRTRLVLGKQLYEGACGASARCPCPAYRQAEA
jgi:hypothetical protein